jgi:hypothetical protein
MAGLCKTAPFRDGFCALERGAMVTSAQFSRAEVGEWKRERTAATSVAALVSEPGKYGQKYPILLAQALPLPRGG